VRCDGAVSRLRVMTYNVKGLYLDVDALVQVIGESAPDVLGLQEPPRGLLGRRRLADLADRTGLRVAVGHGAARTTALLVRPGVAVGDARAQALPWRLGQVRRGYCVARVGGLTVVVLHLALGSAERLMHLDLVLHDLAGTPGPFVVMGDLNERPGGPTWGRLQSGLRDAVASGEPTFSARRPRRRLDAVLVSPELRVAGSSIVSGDHTRRGSDHLPIVVDLDLDLDLDPEVDVDRDADAELGVRVDHAPDHGPDASR
jgi:endonuclease/exonuclease/phosphatase family metal-dependent hydrolase